jgi:hypothetical protein
MQQETVNFALGEKRPASMGLIAQRLAVPSMAMSTEGGGEQGNEHDGRGR